MNKLVLLRHGQSQWNLENRFTGWKDIELSEKGKLEAKESGRLIKEKKIPIDTVYSSGLKRAIDTAIIAMKEANYDHLFNNGELIIIKNTAVNERDYGELTGLNKKETAFLNPRQIILDTFFRRQSSSNTTLRKSEPCSNEQAIITIFFPNFSDRFSDPSPSKP